MKKFSSFLAEAARSQAASQAEKLQLTHVGYGKYADVRGNVTHMSQGGKLVKLDPSQVPSAKGSSGQEEGGSEDKVDQGEVSITFGRFNPPTTGHEALIRRVKAASKNGEYRIYPSRTEDPKKNPLSPEEKINFMRKAYPEHSARIINSPDMRTIFDVLSTLDSEGFSSINIVVGGDRVSEFNSLANKYNGKAYNFETINVSLNPHAEEVISFSGNIGEITGNPNPIKLRTIPNSQVDLSKEVSLLGVVSNLNLKNESFPNVISITKPILHIWYHFTYVLPFYICGTNNKYAYKRYKYIRNAYKIVKKPCYKISKPSK